MSRPDPTDRFTGLACLYARHRPDYPEAALEWITASCRLGPDSLLVDVGCGTGISSRLFAQRGVCVLGVEPNADMRRQAEAEPTPAGCPVPVYRAGTAEATGLPGGTADVVLAAQSFHWFEPEAALREFHRVLRPGGWAALLWNDRDESDPFTAGLGVAFRGVSTDAAAAGEHAGTGRVLLDSPLFELGRRRLFPHEQRLDWEGTLGRAFSVSWAPREEGQVAAFTAAVRDLFDRFQAGGRVVLRYQTTVYLARRREIG